MLHEQALREALEAFEQALEIPIIPGEVQTWSANARDTCHRAVEALEKHVPTWHKRVLDDIQRQDAELLQRVEQMRAEDDQLIEQGRQLQSAADKLVADANSLPSHDPSVKQGVETFVDAGLQWIILIRKQEAALTAWYQEAFNRDRGVAD